MRQGKNSRRGSSVTDTVPHIVHTGVPAKARTTRHRGGEYGILAQHFDRELFVNEQDGSLDLRKYIKAQQFYFLAEQCLNLIKKSLLPMLKKYRLSHSQYLILVVLRYAQMTKRRVMATEIAYLLGLEKHSVSSVVDSLHRRGYLRRTTSSTDRRVIYLRLTEEGLKLIEVVQPQAFETIAAFPETSATEFAIITDFLHRLQALAAENNNQKPEVFQSAYASLLLEGEEKLLKSNEE